MGRTPGDPAMKVLIAIACLITALATAMPRQHFDARFVIERNHADSCRFSFLVAEGQSLVTSPDVQTVDEAKSMIQTIQSGNFQWKTEHAPARTLLVNGTGHMLAQAWGKDPSYTKMSIEKHAPSARTEMRSTTPLSGNVTSTPAYYLSCGSDDEGEGPKCCMAEIEVGVSQYCIDFSKGSSNDPAKQCRAALCDKKGSEKYEDQGVCLDDFLDISPDSGGACKQVTAADCEKLK